METVLPYISQMPDLMNLQHTPEESQEIASRLGDEVEENYQNFLDSLTDPMPFWMYEGEQGEEAMELSWEPAYDFEGQPFTYRVTVSRHADLSQPVADVDGLEDTHYEVPLSQLEEGEYFWRVTAARADGAVAQAQNEVVIDGVHHLGVYNFTVSADPSAGGEGT